MKRIGVLTSGGDAPGMNAAVRSVVRTAIYYDKEVFGINRGYAGMIDGDMKMLKKSDVANIIHRGGTILRTARSEEFRTKEGRAKAQKNLDKHGIEGLVVIGGNGSYTGAMKLSQEYGVRILGIPGTIDNDIYGTDYSIGFDTAINTAVEAVDKIRDTADSHSRLFIIEVMGRHSGYIALHTGIGSGSSAIFLPEKQDSLEEFVKNLENSGRRHKLFNLVIVAEGYSGGDIHEIASRIKKNNKIDVRTAVIGHLQRGGSPSAMDRVLASQLAYNAVKGLIDGKTNVATGLIDKKIVFTPIKDAISLRKAPDESMIKMAEILAL